MHIRCTPACTCATNYTTHKHTTAQAQCKLYRLPLQSKLNTKNRIIQAISSTQTQFNLDNIMLIEKPNKNVFINPLHMAVIIHCPYHIFNIANPIFTHSSSSINHAKGFKHTKRHTGNFPTRKKPFLLPKWNIYLCCVYCGCCFFFSPLRLLLNSMICCLVFFSCLTK